MQGPWFFHTNHKQLSSKLILWFSLPLSLLLPHDHFGVLEGFSLQINLVSDLDVWSDFLGIPKKAFIYFHYIESENSKDIVGM
jgi:hypothetical protein